MNLLQRIAGTVAILAGTSLTSCSRNASSPQAAAPGEAIIVSAAASTKEVVETLSEKFRAASGTEVKVNVGPSNALANQILSGAPADLFLSANQQWAEAVEKGGQAAATVRLLTNQLVIVVPQGNPANVHEPKDLVSAAVKKVALAGEKVPAGRYADQALTKLDLLQALTAGNKIVRAQDVRGALSFVERGEVEAGVVYSTDVRIESGVTKVYDFDPSLHDEIVYVLVLLKHGTDKPAAQELYKYLQSSKADDVYARFGFTRLH